MKKLASPEGHLPLLIFDPFGLGFASYQGGRDKCYLRKPLVQGLKGANEALLLHVVFRQHGIQKVRFALLLPRDDVDCLVRFDEAVVVRLVKQIRQDLLDWLRSQGNQVQRVLSLVLALACLQVDLVVCLKIEHFHALTNVQTLKFRYGGFCPE